MTKTLSEQLCEIVGLPYEKTETNCRVQDSDGDFCEEYVYTLNFEQPENFVKLMELETESQGTILYIISSDYSLSTRKDFLQWLYSRIVRDDHRDRKQEIKQAIRDYDGWVWG